MRQQLWLSCCSLSLEGSVCPLQPLHYCPFQIFIFHLHLQWSSLALSEPLLNLAYVKFSPLLDAFCVKNARVTLFKKKKQNRLKGIFKKNVDK